LGFPGFALGKKQYRRARLFTEQAQNHRIDLFSQCASQENVSKTQYSVPAWAHAAVAPVVPGAGAPVVVSIRRKSRLL
jgi:hypothetical protein